VDIHCAWEFSEMLCFVGERTAGNRK